MSRASRASATLAGLAVIAGASVASAAGTVSTEVIAGRPVRVFVPTTVVPPAALVVMLHGCTQTAEQFADATRMDDVAEENGFVVAYPEQPSAAIPTRCWQWWDPAHQGRDGGEPKELADIAQAVASARSVDPERIYVAGISAGGAMSVILGATWPDRFAAIGVVAGLEYKAATSVAGGLAASQSGGPDPATQGDLVHTTMGSRARVVPTFVVHGTADSVVAKVNGDQVAAQWLRVAGLALGEAAIEPPVTKSGSAGYPFVWTMSRSKTTGASIIEHYVVNDLGHAWPGGRDGGSYADPRGPDASRLMWSFFRGRTISKPLAVPPPIVPSGEPGASDGGASSGGTTSGGAGGGSSSSSGGATSSSGGTEGAADSGCATAPGTRGAPVPLLVAAGSAFAALGLRRRRR